MYVFTYFPDQQTQHRAPNVRSVRWRCRLEQRRTSSPMSFMWILDMLDPEWHIATPEKIETCINEGCFKLRIYIHIRVSYLYYIMYLYNLYLLVPGFPHFQLWAQKKHPNMVFRSVEAVYTPWAVMGWIFPLWDGCWQIRTWSRFAIDSQCHHVPSPGTINYCGAPRRHVEIHSDSNCVANVSRIVKSRSLEDYRFHMISRSQDETPLKADRY